MCRGTIDPFEYGAERVPWFNDIDTVWSFAYNTWGMDRRSLRERKQDPKVLDISWTEYIPPASSTELYTIKTNNFIVKESKMLANPARAVRPVSFISFRLLLITRDSLSCMVKLKKRRTPRSRPALRRSFAK